MKRIVFVALSTMAQKNGRSTTMLNGVTGCGAAAKGLPGDSSRLGHRLQLQGTIPHSLSRRCHGGHEVEEPGREIRVVAPLVVVHRQPHLEAGVAALQVSEVLLLHGQEAPHTVPAEPELSRGDGPGVRPLPSAKG